MELVFRTLGVAQLLFLAALMLQARRLGTSARVGAALCASLAAFLVTSSPGASRMPGPLYYSLTALCATHPAWFWLFCSSLFNDGWKLTRVHVALLLGMATLGALYESLNDSISDPAWATAITAGGLVFAAASLFLALRVPIDVLHGARADLDARRRTIRFVFAPTVATYLAIVVIFRAWVMWTGGPAPQGWVMSNLVMFSVLAAAGLLSFLEIRPVNWLDRQVPEARRDALTRGETRVLEQLEQRLIPERLYAIESLTVSTMAGLLGTQEHILRRVINRGLGFQNFNDFLHTHRLREAEARLRDPKEQRIPILTIALESGYGSIGPFNRAFKERMGQTPSHYRRAQRGADDSRAPSGVPPGQPLHPTC